MSVNGITGGTTDAYQTYGTSRKTDTKSELTKTKTEETADKTGGVVYESSTASTTKKTYKPNAELVAKLKADADERSAQLQSIVQQMISKQGKTLGQADSIWKFLASGDYTVDPSVKAQAQADIAEDGYWGVAKTSDRIIDFATALTGGDPDKIEEMRSAFEKGFKNATDTWGKTLPDISQQTYQAVMDKFDKLAEESKVKTEETTVEQ